MKTKHTLFELSLSALFAAVTVICAWISVPAPIPFTLQTLAIFTACAFLGFKGAVLSTLTYVMLGVIGLPVFAGFRGGFSALIEPGGGFVWGFLLIPLAYGLLCRLFGKKLRACGISFTPTKAPIPWCSSQPLRPLSFPTLLSFSLLSPLPIRLKNVLKKQAFYGMTDQAPPL